MMLELLILELERICYTRYVKMLAVFWGNAEGASCVGAEAEGRPREFRVHQWALNLSALWFLYFK